MSAATLANAVFQQRDGFRPDAEVIELPKSTGTPQSYTYAQLHEMVTSVQAQLAGLQLPPGSTVSSSLINSAEFVAVFLATAAEGYALLLTSAWSPRR